MAYRVKAVTAVIKIGGSERYLHRGAIVPGAATNIGHLLDVGLLEEFELVQDQPVDDEAEKAAAEKAEAEKAAAEKAAAEKAEAEKAAAEKPSGRAAAKK